MKTIVFIGAHDLMVPYINNLTHTHRVYVYESGTFSEPLDQRVVVRPLPKKFFGRKFSASIERSYPWKMSGLISSLQIDRPDDIIVLDFIRLWFWQTLWYSAWNKKVSIHLYSETQRIPPSRLSALAFIIFETVLKVFYKRLTTYFCFTQRGVDFAQKYNNRVPVLLLPAPVDTSIFNPKSDQTFMPNGTLHLLINARFLAYKRHEDIFSAVADLVQEGFDIKISCIGRGDQSGKFLLKKFASKAGIENRITYLDPVLRNELSKIYHQADILVLASDNEAIGMVVPEAMACGIPTITSDTVGANVYVLDNITGQIFKTNDIDDLTHVLKDFCSPDKLAKAGQAAWIHIEDRFTIAKLLPILQKQLSSS